MMRQALKDKLPSRSKCPIAVTMALLGDRWSLVILRDLFIGKRRYGEFLDSPEKITTNILAERLERLEMLGVLTKRPYQMRPKRYDYALTEMGEGLLPVLQEICRWANRYLPDTWTPPASFMTRRPRR